MSRHTDSQAVAAGKSILAGESKSPREILDLVKSLKKERAFGVARRLLGLCAQDPTVRGDVDLRVKIAQQHALCTYKDPDLPASDRFEQALSILRADADLDRTTDRETLGQAGAIYKRKWECTGQEAHLEQSFAYYHRGYLQGTTEDHGWTGINAAYVLDVLAELESVATGDVEGAGTTARLRKERARQIRRELVARLTPLCEDPKNEWLSGEWWFLVTLAEAHFGLDEFRQAGEWLRKAKALRGVPDWEQESTARQLASLLTLKRRGPADTARAAHDCLAELLGNNKSAVESVTRGKIGLALSGGGFRASLFHIGVLARLAELDLLRSVECLSCVSGGSIIGAYYYLEVRKLLNTKRDDQITTEDYVEIIQRIEREFLAGVQRNIRTRILADWWSSVKMMFAPDYSRTRRAGELYESELYARVKDGEHQAERWLDKLTVNPPDEPPDFRPKDHNWRRANKVPILVLNATTLNTGHNWQFTATWMGEPPGSIDTRIDANYRLRRMYYDEAPPGNTKVRLGDAVAASACVPGIFEPLPLTHLYARESDATECPGGGVARVEPVVRLVDGGVHDNQGIAALLDQGCSVLLVSDACGQMNAADFPKSGMLGVPLRANSILQARVREAQYQDVATRRGSRLLKGLMFIHLKQDLEMDPVDWIDCQDPSRRATRRPLTSYGVQRGIQRSLAGIRTDLDSFSDAEALSLMCSGYLMTAHALAAGMPLDFVVPGASRQPWRFLKVEPLLKQPGEDNPLLCRLRAADKLFLKAWLLCAPLKVIGSVFALAMLFALGWIAWRSWGTAFVSLTVGQSVVLLAGATLSLAGLSWVLKVARYRKTVEQILVGLGLACVGALLARLHLHVIDRIFLRNGSLARLLGKSGPPPGGAPEPASGHP
jgi:predicted acylesterase/phospholipase RssA